MITIWHTCVRCKTVTEWTEDDYDDGKYHRDDLCEKCREKLNILKAELKEQSRKQQEGFLNATPDNSKAY